MAINEFNLTRLNVYLKLTPKRHIKMKTNLPSIATFVFLTITFFPDASLAGGPHVNASEVNWRSTYTDYGPEFAKAFRFKTLDSMVFSRQTASTVPW